MNPTKIVLWGLLLGLCPFFSFAQMRYYHTQNYMETLAEAHPEVTTNRLDLETATQQYFHNQSPQALTIPIVFHILYANTTEQLSTTQIQSQLDALNSDFAMSAPIMAMSNDPYNRYLDRATNTDIQFCSPTFAPSNMPTSGINYVSVAANLSDNLEQIKQTNTGATAWDTEHYLNVWVCRLPDDLSGYAQMPGGIASTDGIVIDYRFFGTMGTVQSPYDLGHTLTHLVGNYLNLYPLWGFEKCGSDYVNDTPHHNAPNTANTGNLVVNCATYQHVSTCTGYPLEMTMNFMDNTSDACMYMFTAGQRRRMHATLNVDGGRNQLALQATNCTSTLQGTEIVNDRNNDSNTTINQPQPELHVFPNPATTTINIVVSAAFVHPSTSIEIYNAQGQILYHSPKGIFADTTFKVNVSDYTAGIYFIKARSEQDLLTRKFSIQ